MACFPKNNYETGDLFLYEVGITKSSQNVLEILEINLFSKIKSTEWKEEMYRLFSEPLAF